MEVTVQHVWPRSVEEAVELQEHLRSRLVLTGEDPSPVTLVAGLDVAYAPLGGRLAAAVVVTDVESLTVADSAVAVGQAGFDYVPGLFAFRELPILVEALKGLSVTPDLLMCDGHGIAHPRRFGLACHLGVLTDLPTIGVAKTPLIGSFPSLAPDRGAWMSVCDQDEEIGRALRTRPGVKPVFVSVGHRVTLDAACRRVLDLSPRYRIPEPIRRADQLSRSTLRGAR